MSPSFKTIPILSTDVAQVDYSLALDIFRDWTESHEAVRTVIAANVHVVTEAALDRHYRNTVADADLVVPDGMPLVWASRLLGSTITERCYGPALMEHTLEAFTASGGTHFFYGSSPPVLEALVTNAQQRWPALQIAGTCAPGFGPLDDAEQRANIEAINATEADFLWVGMGCPKQEVWMQRYRRHLRPCVVVAVGAAFDFLAGAVPQAPGILQRSGLEWLYRLAMEPRRLWRRYCFRNPYFVAAFATQYARHVASRIAGTHRR